MHWDSLPVVRRGTWLYDGAVEREVRIVVSPKYYGTGDYEDEPEIADDRDVVTFVVLFQTLDLSKVQFGGGEQFGSLVEAIESAETVLAGRLRWHDAGCQAAGGDRPPSRPAPQRQRR